MAVLIVILIKLAVVYYLLVILIPVRSLIEPITNVGWILHHVAKLISCPKVALARVKLSPVQVLCDRLQAVSAEDEMKYFPDHSCFPVVDD